MSLCQGAPGHSSIRPSGRASWPGLLAEFPLHLGGDLGKPGFGRAGCLGTEFWAPVAGIIGQAQGCHRLAGLEDSEYRGIARLRGFFPGPGGLHARFEPLVLLAQPPPGLDHPRQQPPRTSAACCWTAAIFPAACKASCGLPASSARRCSSSSLVCAASRSVS